MNNSSFFSLQKKNTFRSLHYSPDTSKEIDNQDKFVITGAKKPFKPEFLYFTQRQRQSIHLLDKADFHKSTKTSRWQKRIDQKIQTSFQKKFKMRSKYFQIKKISCHSYHKNKNSLIGAASLKIQCKIKPTLRKKAIVYKNQQPCVGMYDAKPQNLMKRLAKNEIFKKGKSCHILSQIKQTCQKQQQKTIVLFQNDVNGEKVCQKRNLRSNMCKKKANLMAFLGHSSDQQFKKAKKMFQVKIKIKCFDMSRQISRAPLKTIKNKHEQFYDENCYIENNYRRTMFMPKPLNELEVQNCYTHKKQKYEIEQSCEILKHIKLKDFIKAHRKQLAIEEENFQ